MYDNTAKIDTKNHIMTILLYYSVSTVYLYIKIISIILHVSQEHKREGYIIVLYKLIV